MSDEPTFTDKLVSQLGTPKEPFGLDDLLFLSLLLAAVAAYIALEYGAVRLIRRLIIWLSDRVAPKGRGDK